MSLGLASIGVRLVRHAAALATLFVPLTEPSSLFLLGLGLVGVAKISRTILQQKANAQD
jgi:hypothetical protein